MKKRFLSVAAAVLAVAAMSCSKSNNDTTTPPVTSDTLGGLKGDTLWGKIRMNITLEANKTYYLDGPTFVKSGYTLTVNAGAKILAIKKGRTTRSASNSFLVVTRGAKLVAEGTATSPIVFSSAEAKGARATSDWGGLMILGKAPVNTTFNGAVGRQMEGFSDNDAFGYGDDIVGGGSDAADNSGVLKYVRVEFAGIALSNKANSELNSITFIGVGNGTTIDYVQSSFSGDDSFEWFGGTVNAKHLIAYRGLDDDFDTDNGFSGKVQFGLSIRDKDISDYALPGDSNGFESDNDETGTGSTPTTSPVFSNFTILGPAAINGGANISATAVFNRSAHIRRNSRLSLFNSALAGFVTGLLIDGDKSAAVAGNDSLEIKNTFIGAIGGVKSGVAGKKVTSNVGTFDAGAWFMKAGFNNDTTINTIDGFKFTNMSGELNTIDARPASGSPLLNKASFTSSTKISNSFFTVVTYAGAFSGSSDTWATGWTNFDPKNATY